MFEILLPKKIRPTHKIWNFRLFSASRNLNGTVQMDLPEPLKSFTWEDIEYRLEASYPESKDKDAVYVEKRRLRPCKSIAC